MGGWARKRCLVGEALRRVAMSQKAARHGTELQICSVLKQDLTMMGVHSLDK